MKYDFKCPKCGKIYELQMPVKDYVELKDRLTCDDCHEVLVRTYTTLAKFVMEKKE